MSIQLLETVMCWEATFDLEIDDERLAKLDTPARAVDFLAEAIGAPNTVGACLSLRAYQEVRRVIRAQCPNVSRHDITLDAALTTLIGRKLEDWRRLFEALDLPSCWISAWPIFGAGRVSVGHVTSRYVTERGAALLRDGESWTRSQVRDVVRSSVGTAAGNVRFSDDDSFVSMGF